MNKFWKRLLIIAIASLMLSLFGVAAHAQDGGEGGPPPDPPPVEEAVLATGDDIASLQIQLDTTWILLCGFLVFFMQTGFAMLEAGFIRHTGVVNALLENFVDAGLTAIVFWAVGFGIAFGADSGGLIGTDNFFLSEAMEISEGSIIYKTMAQANPDVGLDLSVLNFFFFQFAFAATASTIATGALAERTDFIGDLIYSAVIGALIYPIVVHWIWGGGWLTDRSFHDFAGSTVVHAVGGVTALVGAWLMGPRPNRKFGEFPPPHNFALAALGGMILWVGWYGFNPGSTLGTSDPNLIGLVAVNTTLAAGAGAVVAMLFVFTRTGKWDISFTINGALAGLVGITAGCAFVMPWAAVLIGMAAGMLVVVVVEFVERIKIDDAVGAFAVHGACGIWGTLAIGLFGQPELLFGEFAGEGALLTGGGVDLLATQLTGVAGVVAFVALSTGTMFAGLKMMGRLRVDSVGDAIGIDVYEHGVSLWPDVLPISDITYIGTEVPKGATARQVMASSEAAGD